MQANGTKSKSKASTAEQKNSTASNLNGNALKSVPPLASVQKTSQPAKNSQQSASTVIKQEPGATQSQTTSTQQQQQQQQQPSASSSQSSSTTAANNGPPALQQSTLDPNKQIPIQITLPPQPNETENRVLTIKVPARAIQENQLQQVITGEIITSIMPLQPAVASAVLQQHVNSVLNNMYAKSECQLNAEIIS
jgi:transcription initiation factor TFIIA large subunit